MSEHGAREDERAPEQPDARERDPTDGGPRLRRVRDDLRAWPIDDRRRVRLVRREHREHVGERVRHRRSPRQRELDHDDEPDRSGPRGPQLAGAREEKRDDREERALPCHVERALRATPSRAHRA